MAKKSSIEKNNRRTRMAKQYAAKRAELKAMAVDNKLSPEERFGARLKLAKLPRNSSPTRIRNRCEITGRPRAVYRKFKLSRLALPHLLARPGASIINTVSPGAYKAPRGFIPHYIAKTALAHLTRLMAADLGPRVRVNAIVPSSVETPALKPVLDSRPEFRETLVRNIRMRRLSTPEEVGYAAVYLASPAAGFVTGTLLDITGGHVDEIMPMMAPMSLFVWSAARIVPVRLTDFSITEEAFDPLLVRRFHLLEKSYAVAFTVPLLIYLYMAAMANQHQVRETTQVARRDAPVSPSSSTPKASSSCATPATTRTSSPRPSPTR